MNSRDAHQHRLHSHPQAEPNGASSMEAQNEELEEMGMRTDLRAGSPCRQAASEIMEDLSMDTRMNEQTYSEAFRRDMLNVFPGHPALPQQTPPFRGEGLTQEHSGSGPTIIRDYGPSKSMFEFGPPTIPENEPLFEDQQMVSDQQLLTEPDWITQMLEQVQKVGLWNEPFSMEPLRPDLPPQVTTSTASTQPVQAMDISDTNPIPFYKQNMESLMNLPSGCSDVTTELLVPQAPAVELQIPGVPSTVAPSTVPPAQAQPPLQNLGKSFSMPSSSGGIGVINQSQRPTTEEYVNILKNALSIPGMGAALNRESTVSLELSKDGMNEVIESSRQKSMNDGPFRPPTRQHTCGRLAGMRSMDSGCSNPMLQQSELQLQLGLAADSPIDLRHWGYGEAARNSDDVKPAEKRMKTSDCVQTMGTAAEVAQRIMATSAGSVPSAGPSNVLQEGTDVKQQSPLSGGLERLQQASDRKSGLSADEVTRLESLERYREKKRRRLHTKTIRYYKRKVNADARKRYKGRFVKAESAGQDNMGFSNDRVTDASSYHSMSAEVSDLKTV